MPKYEDGILGFIPQKDWLDVGFNVRRQNDPIDGLFDDVRTDNIMAYWQSIADMYQIPMMAQFHGFDTESQTTFRVPVDTHNIEKGLIKVKINQSERMQALLKSGIREDDMYDYVVNDGVRLADQVVTRSKVAKNELMATGKVTIKENNLNLTVDYGCTRTGYTIDLAVGADIDSQIRAIVDAATDVGVTLNGMMTSKKNITKMRQNTGLQININGTSGSGALLKNDAFNAYLEDEYGITDVITNDLKYGASATIDPNTGRPVINTKKYYPEDKITFFATGQGGRLGSGLWGDPPESYAGNFMKVNASGESPYVYVSQWMEKDPAVLWTKASGLFMPVLFNPDSIWIATVSN